MGQGLKSPATLVDRVWGGDRAQATLQSLVLLFALGAILFAGSSLVSRVHAAGSTTPVDNVKVYANGQLASPTNFIAANNLLTNGAPLNATGLSGAGAGVTNALATATNTPGGMALFNARTVYASQMGSVSDSHVALTPATGTATFSGNLSANDTVTVGTSTYTLVSSYTSTAKSVVVGASTAATIQNLAAAINLSAGSGTVYGSSTTVNPFATAAANATTLVTTSTQIGAWVNGTIATTKSAANLAWGATTMGGATDGTVGTNDTSALQALLNLASGGTPVHVIIDGQFAVASTLSVYPLTTITHLAGCGIILAPGVSTTTNVPVYANAHPVNNGTPVDHDISIDGPGVLNGNGNTQTFNATHQTGAVILSFHGVDNLHVSGVYLQNACAFATSFENLTHSMIDHVQVYQTCTTSNTANQDALHFNGPDSNTMIDHCVWRTNDDGVALNADDLGDSAFVAWYGISYGAITNVTVDRCVVNNGYGAAKSGGVRLLSGGSLIDKIYVSGITGTSSAFNTFVDNGFGFTLNNPGNGNFGTITFDGINVQSTGVTTIQCNGSFSSLKFLNLQLTNAGFTMEPQFAVTQFETGGDIFNQSSVGVPTFNFASGAACPAHWDYHLSVFTNTGSLSQPVVKMTAPVAGPGGWNHINFHDARIQAAGLLDIVTSGNITVNFANLFYYSGSTPTALMTAPSGSTVTYMNSNVQLNGEAFSSGSATYVPTGNQVIVQTGTLSSGTSTKTVPSGSHPWVTDNTSATNLIGVTVSGTTATITGTGSDAYSLFTAGSL